MLIQTDHFITFLPFKTRNSDEIRKYTSMPYQQHFQETGSTAF